MPSAPVSRERFDQQIWQYDVQEDDQQRRGLAMDEVSTAEAKRDLSHLLRRVEAGERITITRYGEPIAVLHPAKRRAGSRAELRAEHGRSQLDPLDELMKARAEIRF